MVKRFREYWDFREPLERPVVNIAVPSKHERRDIYFGSDFNKTLDYWVKVFDERKDLMDDCIPNTSTFFYFGHAFMPSLAGAPLRVSENSTWSEPILDSLEHTEDIRLDWESENWKRFREFYDFFSDRSAGRFAVPQHLAKSPGELMCSLRDPQKLIYDFFDTPDLVKEFGEKCADLSIEYSRRILTDVPLTAIDGGHVYCWANWVPGDAACFSEDYTANWSPQIYNEFIKPLDRRFISSFSISNMEWHSGNNHIFPCFPKVSAVEFNLDPVHDSIKEAFKYLLPYKGEIRLQIPCEKHEVRSVIETFGIKGIMITTSCDSVKEGNRLLDDISKWSDQYKKQNKEPFHVGGV